ncbi:MAG: ComEC/Rec2 family competence protein [Bacteroidota bacterium]
MKINWHEHPFLRIFIAFALGVVFASLVELNLTVYICFSILFGVLFFATKTKSKNYTWRWFSGFALNFFLFFVGAISYHFQVDKNSNNFAGNYLLSDSKVLFKVVESPVEKEKTIKVEAEIISINQNLKWHKTQGKILAYFRKDNLSKNINYGDVLVLNTTITKVEEPLDPYEYNYKNYLENHNIYFQTYVANNSVWAFYEKDKGNPIKKWSLSVRDYFLDILTENKITENNFAVAAALVIGYEDKLTNDTYSLFSEAGVLHILSVSGLHVAIIFYVFSSMFQFVEKLKYGKIIKAVLLLFSLWFYASVTGLSPSVMRSAAMFSIVVVAQLLKQRASIFNSMSASAFILLLVNPLTLFDVGFQLSYLAVLGIVTFNPLFDKLYEPQNWLSKQIWSIVSVSISAQLITLPISLYYFNQFPTYFLLANLIIIPLSTIILYLGLALALLGKIAFIAAPIAWLFNQTISFLLFCSELITKLPNASIQHIYFSITDMFIVYAFLGFFLLFFYTKKGKHLVYSLLLLLLFSIVSTIEKHNILDSTIVQIHAIKKKSVYTFTSNNNAVIIADSNFYKDSFSKKWMSNFITKQNAETISQQSVYNLKSDNLDFYKTNQNIVFTPYTSAYLLNKETSKYNFNSKLDYVIVGNISVKQFKKIAEKLTCKNIVLDGSVPLYKATEMSAWLQKRNFNVRYVLQTKTIRL